MRRGARKMTLKPMYGLACALLLSGCVTQEAHDRAMSELNETQEELAQLQGKNQELASAVEKLEQDKQVLEQTMGTQEQAMDQLQETNKELEQAIEVQDQIKDQQLEAMKKELGVLYDQVLKMAPPSSEISNPSNPLSNIETNFDDLNKALKQVREILGQQVGTYSQLNDQNSRLEKDLVALQNRLQEVERLKKELEQVRREREAQEAKLAKVKHEVLTVGEEIDRITKALEEKFGKSLVVTQHQDRLVLTVLGHVLFESGEAELTPLGLNIMKQVGQLLATLPEKSIQVEGHTDNNPIYGLLQKQYATNWELSTARATTVVRYLIEQTGMDPKNFSAAGYADTRPVMSNDTEEGRSQNRRVEIVLYPDYRARETEKIATLTP